MLGRGAILLLLVSAALAGCLGGDDDGGAGLDRTAVDASIFDGLGAEGATVTRGADTLTFAWEDVMPTGLSGIPLVGATGLTPTKLFAFDVAPGLGYVEASLDAGDIPLGAYVVDLDKEPQRFISPLDQVFLFPPGAVECNADYGPSPRVCTTPLPRDLQGTTQWGVWVVNEREEEVPFTLTVTLHPPQHVTLGDPSARLDPALRLEARATGFGSQEPTLGLISDGTIFAVSGANVIRSADDGVTWEDVTPPHALPITLDPMLRVDPWTDRVILDSLYVACSWAVWSDDGGSTWLGNPAVCGTPVNDHQKMAVGGTDLPVAPYDGILYYLYSDFDDGDVVISRSLDGGVTWISSLAISPTLHGVAVRRGGPVEADREGNVYTPGYICPTFDSTEGRGVAVGYSNDFGLTYEVATVTDMPHGCEGIDPGMAIDAAGTAYAAWWAPVEGEDGNAVFVAFSGDHGPTWSEPIRVSPPELRSFEFVDAVAGDAGRVAVTFTATPDSGKGPNRADGWARWYTYVAITEDAFAAEPVWHLTQVQPMDGPVQLGCIWTNGGGSDCRNLLDFDDIQVGPDGRVYVIFSNGCTEPPCDTPSDTRGSDGFIAVQTAGPRLYTGAAPWAGSAAPARPLAGAGPGITPSAR